MPPPILSCLKTCTELQIISWHSPEGPEFPSERLQSLVGQPPGRNSEEWAEWRRQQELLSRIHLERVGVNERNKGNTNISGWRSGAIPEKRRRRRCQESFWGCGLTLVLMCYKPIHVISAVELTRTSCLCLLHQLSPEPCRDFCVVNVSERKISRRCIVHVWKRKSKPICADILRMSENGILLISSSFILNGGLCGL